MIATIQSYHELKGFGWLLLDFRTRLFFHISQWQADFPPVEGMKVYYEVGAGHVDGKTQAINIKPLDGAL